MIGHLRPNLGKSASALNGVLVKGLPWGVTEVSLFNGASPAIDNGDFAVFSPATLPDGFGFSLSSTGVPTILSAGSVARQNVQLDVYDMTFRMWFGQVTDYVNDTAPLILDHTNYTIFYNTNVAISDINLGSFATDIEGDLVTISTASTLPPGLVLAANFLTGTPTVIGSYPVTFVATDILGLSTNFPVWTFVVQANQLAHLERGQHGWMRSTFLGR